MQSTVERNSELDARHNKDGLFAVASRQGHPCAMRPLTKPLHAPLPYTISSACSTVIPSHHRGSISYAVYPLFSPSILFMCPHFLEENQRVLLFFNFSVLFTQIIALRSFICIAFILYFSLSPHTIVSLAYRESESTDFHVTLSHTRGSTPFRSAGL